MVFLLWLWLQIGGGLRAIQVRRFYAATDEAKAFYAVRKDGSTEDFSFLKACQKLFPGQ